jgi:hypothetical protein
MFLLKVLISICFVIVGVLMYYMKVCVVNDCKLKTPTGYRNIMPIEGFVLPFKKLFELNPVLFLKLMVSPSNPWLYMTVMFLISLIVVNVSLKTNVKNNNNKQLTMNDLYPEQS